MLPDNLFPAAVRIIFSAWRVHVVQSSGTLMSAWPSSLALASFNCWGLNPLGLTSRWPSVVAWSPGTVAQMETWSVPGIGGALGVVSWSPGLMRNQSKLAPKW